MPKRKNKKTPKHQLIIISLSIFLLLLIAFLIKFSPYTKPPIPKTKEVIETPEVSLVGKYSGSLPCADCSGIKETLTLTASDSAQTKGGFLMEDIYEGRNTEPFETKGSWVTPKDMILELTPNEPNSQPQYFQILQNGNLQMLDSNMEKIDSPFNQILIKQ